jgi:hypothetical protein
VASRRPREAWQETGTAWKPELAYGGVGGALSLTIFAATGWPQSAAVTATVPIASAVGAAILVPLVQFLWGLLWQPWNDLKATVADLADDDGPMQVKERLMVVLRDYLRQGLEMEALRSGSSSYRHSEVEELDDWTHDVTTVLTEYGTKEQCVRFIEAHIQFECGNGFAAHREWAAARVVSLEQIIAALDPSFQPAAPSKD